jgi:hypothetical protein
MANAQTPPTVSALEIQNMITAETSDASAGFADAPEATEYHMLKQYMWKHPNRAGRITLYSGPGGNKVSFSHLADGTAYEDCTPHGSWDQQEKLLRICFHHEANPDKIEKHTFVRHDPNLDVWYMAGPHEGWSAAKFAFIQPWFDAAEIEQ